MDNKKDLKKKWFYSSNWIKCNFISLSTSRSALLRSEDATEEGGEAVQELSREQQEEEDGLGNTLKIYINIM